MDILFDNHAKGEFTNESLNEDNDFFDLLPKAKILTNLIKQFPDSLSKIKMLSLYGDWGSGKTTVLDYISKQIGVGDDFIILKFNAWEYENSNNISLCLLDLLLEHSEHSLFVKVRNQLKELLSFAKYLATSSKVRVGFSDLNITFEPEKAISALEEDKINSYYTLLKKYKKSYSQLEEDVLKKSEKKILFLIDDLDRCETSKILDVLSQIKFFFTYGTSSVFLCALDKVAISKAIQHRYKDIIKSEEYLEKLFDISFCLNASTQSNPLKLVEYIFTAKRTGLSNPDDVSTFTEYISDFLKFIDFTNPRRLKKLMNKYIILEYLANSSNGDFPHLKIEDDKSLNLVGTIFTLYLLILNEFYPECIKSIANSQDRLFQIIDINKTMHRNEKITFSNNSAKYITSPDFILQESDFYLKDSTRPSPDAVIIKLINIFLPPNDKNPDINLDAMKQPSTSVIGHYITSFTLKDYLICSKFCEFILKELTIPTKDSDEPKAVRKHIADIRSYNLNILKLIDLISILG